MTKEFKKIIKNNETHYVLEDASAGATSASSIAAVESPLGPIRRRIKKIREKIETVSVPASNKPPRKGTPPTQTGAGAHRDKKKEQKQGQEKHKKPFYEQMMEELEALAELDKPSGSLILKFRGKRLPGDEMMALGYGGFGTTPKDVTTKNAVIKPFHADDSYDVINKIESLFKDKDFVGVEKIILDIPNALAGQLRDVLDYAEQDPERFELYTGDDSEEPEAKTGGKVIGYGPDGKRIDRTPPKAQVGGSSRGIASTGMVTVQADSNGQRLISGLVSQGKLSRDTKVQGNKITLRKDDYSKMMSVLGNAKFQQMFTKVGSVAETQGSRPIDKFRSKPSWDDGSEPADKNSPYYVAWSGQAWDDEDTSRPKGDAGRILVINIDDKHTAQELAKHYDQLFKVGKFPDELAHSKYVDYSGTYVGSMKKMDGYEKEMLRYDLRSGIVKDYSKEDPVNELSKDTLRSYSQAAGREVGDDQRDARSARDKAIHHISHGELKKGADWSDEADWLNKRAEKRAGGIARATSKIAQKGMEEGDESDHEISMASSELTSIAKDAANLLDIVRQRSEEEGLEAWQQSKITKAADYMNSVLQSISGDEEQGVAEGENIGGERYDKIADLQRRSFEQLTSLIKKLEQHVEKYPQDARTNEYLGLARMIRAQKIGKKGVAEGSKQQLPIVLYKEISPDQTQGREFFQIVKSQSPLWKVGDTFSDDDMSMGSRQVRFVSVEQGVAEVSSSFQGKLDREKDEFKRRELEVELGHERQPHRPAAPPPKGMYFYNVSPGQERTAQMVGLKQTKSGKWYSKYPNPEAGGKFGPGRYWEPKSEGVAEGSDELDSGQKRALIDAFKYHWKGGSVEKAIGHVIRSLYVAQYLKSNQFGAAEDFLYRVADMEQGHDEPRPDHEEDRMGLGLSHDSSKNMKEGPEENKRWRKEARKASDENRPWSPINLPNYKKSKEQGVGEGYSELGNLNKKFQELLDVYLAKQAAGETTPTQEKAIKLLQSLVQGEQQGVEEGKIKGVDGKACWKGKRYAGKVKKADGTYKDKCVPVGEDAYINSLTQMLNDKVK